MNVEEIRKLLSDPDIVAISALHGRILLEEIDRLNKQLKKPKQVKFKDLRARALHAATSWLKPTHKLDEREATMRCVHMWLSGYDSRRRDERKR